MFVGFRDIENSKYANHGTYLHEQHFLATIGLAVLLHLIGFGIYALVPKSLVEEIPVQTLNIKLGNSNNDLTELSRQAMKANTIENYNDYLNASEASEVKAKSKLKATSFQNPLDSLERQLKSKAPIEKPRISKKTPAEKTAQVPKQAIKNDQKQYVRSAEAETAGEKTPKVQGSQYGNSQQQQAEIQKRYTQTLSLWIDRHKVYPSQARRMGQGGLA